jgi:transposase
VIGSTRQVAVWAYGAPADLRNGFDGLSALVGQGLGRDPLSGDCYLFVNATRKRAKVLLWDGTGLCLKVPPRPRPPLLRPGLPGLGAPAWRRPSWG